MNLISMYQNRLEFIQIIEYQGNSLIQHQINMNTFFIIVSIEVKVILQNVFTICYVILCGPGGGATEEKAAQTAGPHLQEFDRVAQWPRNFYSYLLRASYVTLCGPDIWAKKERWPCQLGHTYKSLTVGPSGPGNF